jgi:hypothetical protein
MIEYQPTRSTSTIEDCLLVTPERSLNLADTPRVHDRALRRGWTTCDQTSLGCWRARTSGARPSHVNDLAVNLPASAIAGSAVWLSQ